MPTFADFIKLCNAHPWAYIALFINIVVVFINGYTDGPSTIATAVHTRAIKPRTAFIISAVFNLLGALAIGAFSMYLSKVFGGDIVDTVSSLVNFGSASIDRILCAIACGLIAIIVVSQICTHLGLPSSQSNCLIGGLTGGGLVLMALGCGGSIGLLPWIKVAGGFVGSLLVGFLLGFGITKLIEVICRNMNKGKTNRFFNNGQIVSSALMNFVHGIQDGGKFIGISVLIFAILHQDATLPDAVDAINGTWWIYIPVAMILAVGCLLGNRKILNSLGRGMANINNYQAFATDIASSIGLLVATLFGLPLSTGTIKNTAIMGTASTRSVRRVKWKKAGQIVLWNALAFPLSALAAFILAIIFVWTVK